MKADFVLVKQKKTLTSRSEWKKQYLKVRDGVFSFADTTDGATNREGQVKGIRVLEANREQKAETFLWKIYYHNPGSLAKQSLKQSMAPVLIKSTEKKERRSWIAVFKDQGARVDSVTLKEANLTYVSTYEKFKKGKPLPKPLYALVYNGVLQFYKTRADWANYNPAIEIDLLKGTKIEESQRDTLKPPMQLWELTDHLGGIHMLATGADGSGKSLGQSWVDAIRKCIFAPADLDTPQQPVKSISSAGSPAQSMASPVRESQFFSPAKEEEPDLTQTRARKATVNDSQGPAVHFRGASIDVSSLDMSSLKKDLPTPENGSIKE